MTADELFGDLHSSGGADSFGTCFDHGHAGFQIPNAAGGFDLHGIANDALHQLDVIQSCTAGAETGGGLDEIRLHFQRDLAEDFLFFLSQVAVFENDFADDIGLPAFGNDLAHLFADVVVVAVLQLGNVDDIVDLVSAVLNGVHSFKNLGSNGGLAEREANGSTNMNVCILQELFAELNLHGVDSDHGKIVGTCFVAQFLHMCLSSVSIQAGVVKEFYQLFFCHCVQAPFVACNALVSLFTIFSQYYTSVFQYKLNKTINIMILDKAGKLSFKSFENPEAYNKIQRAQTSNKIYPFISYILSIIQLSITFISYGAIILSWKWWSIFLILPNACFSTFLANRLNKKRYEMLRYRTEEERKKWYFQYLLTNDIAFKEIRTYNLAEYFIHKVKGIYDDFFKQDKSYYKKSSEISLLISILDELCMGVLFCIVIFDTYAGNILIGDSVAYINVSSNIKSTLKQLLAQISAIYNDNLYINQIFEFLDMPEEEQIKRMEKHIDEINTITVENLSYRYNSNNRYALKDVSFSLSKGDIVAIVGKNGAGKSTLAKILSVLYNDYEGSIVKLK